MADDVSNLRFTKATPVSSSIRQAIEKIDGYYYVMDSASNSLLVKTDDGNTAFQYPLDTTISTPVKEIKHDGAYFWTLQSGTGHFYIRRWFIQNYLCKLQSTIDLTNNVDDTFSSDTMAIEHYHRKLTAPATISGTSIELDSTDRMPGAGGKLFLGPSTSLGYEGLYEERSVASVSGTTVNFSGDLDYSYATGDMCHFNTKIWLFNNFNRTASNEGAVYEIDSRIADTLGTVTIDSDAAWGTDLTVYPGTEFKNITGATYATYNYYSPSSGVVTPTPLLMFVYSSNLLFLDTSQAGNSVLDLAAMQEVYKADDANLWTVLNITVEDTYSDVETDESIKIKRDTLYRLQDGVTYGGVDQTTNSTINYAMTTMKPYVFSIGLSVTPAVISADSTATAAVVATVRDQYNLPVSGVSVAFTENDSVDAPDGAEIVSPISTNTNGQATTTFTAGNAEKTVRVTATVTDIIPA